MFENCKRKEQRYKLLRVSPELMLETLLTTKKPIDVIGLPDGVSVDAVCWDDYRRCFNFRLWHKDWELLEACQVIPEVNVTVQERHLDRPCKKCGDLLVGRLAAMETCPSCQQKPGPSEPEHKCKECGKDALYRRTIYADQYGKVKAEEWYCNLHTPGDCR